MKNFMVCLLTGLPDDVVGLDIPSGMVTACSFMVQCSEVFGHLVCGSIWYTVRITKGTLIITNTTILLTNYNVTGLRDNTPYYVSVTASNDAGSSSSATSMMTTKHT